MLVKIRIDGGALLGIEGGRINNHDSLTLQSRLNVLPPVVMGGPGNLANLFPDQLELRRGRPAVATHIRAAAGDLLHQSRDPNHKEFVQVRPQNGKELHPLQQRVILVYASSKTRH